MHNRQSNNHSAAREKVFLEKISARIAPRNAWQAMDLGVRIYQTWWKPLTLIWLAVTLAPLVLLVSLTGIDNALWGCLAWWWLKPLWERPLLEYCARTLFADVPTIKQLIRELPRHTLSGIIPWLFLRRLDPSRGMHLAVTQLEKQRGDAYRLRVRNLSLGINDHSASLTMIMLLIEQLITVGIIMLIAMLAPDQYYLREMDWVLEDSQQTLWLFVGAWYLATTVCEPLYICCSFALYLNKRTWLEGWDLELGMRQIGEKRRAQASHFGVALLLLFSVALSQLPSRANAEDLPLPDVESSMQKLSAKERAIEVVAGPQFMPMDIKESWRFKDLFSNEEDAEEENNNEDAKRFWERIFDWIASLFDGDDKKEDEKGSNNDFELPTLAEIFRFIVWVIVVSVVIWLTMNARRWLKLIDRKKRYNPRATHVAGLDIRPESLPDDVTAHALAALDQGNLRDALSLLYRATLSTLLSRIDADITPGATESECLRAVQIAQQKTSAQISQIANTSNPEVAPVHASLDDAGVLFLQTLTPLWISTAWAHRPPEHKSIRDLAFQWHQLFGAPASQQTKSAANKPSLAKKGTHQ
jgi:hypothetical protein